MNWGMISVAFAACCMLFVLGPVMFCVVRRRIGRTVYVTTVSLSVMPMVYHWKAIARLTPTENGTQVSKRTRREGGFEIL